MEQCVLTIGTVTHAISARRLLSAAGIPARLIKSTQSAARSGCAYGLEIAAIDMPRATRILDESGIAYEWTRTGVR